MGSTYHGESNLGGTWKWEVLIFGDLILVELGSTRTWKWEVLILWN